MSNGSPDKSSTEMAEDRTDWAEDRTVLANERTFAGWMRTGMAAVAIAIGLKAVFGEFEPTWLAKAVSSVFIIAALGIFWSSWRRCCKTLERLNAHHATPVRPLAMTVTVFILAAGAVATGAILWLL